MPGQGSKQLPQSSIAVNRARRANAGKNKKYEEPEYCCDSADGSERREVYIDKNDGNIKKCPYSSLPVEDCVAVKRHYNEEEEDTESSLSEEEDTESQNSLSDNLKLKLGIRYAEAPSTPEATQPQCPGAPGGTFDHSPVPPDFSPTQVEFPPEDKDDVARLVSSEMTPEKEEVYVFPDTETESEDEQVRLQSHTKEIKKEIKKLKRRLEEATERIEVLIETNQQLMGTVINNRNAINEQRREILKLKRQRNERDEALPLHDIEVVDLTLE